MRDLPEKLRYQVVKFTHGPICEQIHFFNKQDSAFSHEIAYQLEPFNLMEKEILYQKGDDQTKIYFIYQGQFKLFMNINDYIDENHDVAFTL